jgi:uncharacterized protein YjiS (DUF1127 family)
MTNLDATALHEPGIVHGKQGWWRAVAHAVAAILGPLVRAYRARSQTRHLESFSDHLLTDIGISRDEIDAGVRWGRGGHQPWR